MAEMADTMLSAGAVPWTLKTLTALVIPTSRDRLPTSEETIASRVFNFGKKTETNA